MAGGSGTTNVGSIFEVGGDIYIAVDGRVSDKDIIKTEEYPKIVKMGDFYLTVCGAIKVHHHMQQELRSKLKELPDAPIQEVAQWATEYFRKTCAVTLANIGVKPKDEKSEEFERWQKRDLKWMNHHNTLSLICGFDENKNPKVYIANDRYEVPLDISKAYTSDQIRTGIKKEDASKAIDMKYPHHTVRGSCSQKVTKYIEDSPFFVSIKDVIQNNMDLEAQTKQQRLVDVSFDEIAMEYAKVLLHACLYDKHTGGNLCVKKISKDGSCRTLEWNLIRLYLSHFLELEKEQVLFVLIPRKNYNKTHVDALSEYFRSFDKSKTVTLHPLGFIKGFVMFRLKMQPKEGNGGDDMVNGLLPKGGNGGDDMVEGNGGDDMVDGLLPKEGNGGDDMVDWLFDQVLSQNTGEGGFGMKLITKEDLSCFIGRPTPYVVECL